LAIPILLSADAAKATDNRRCSSVTGDGFWITPKPSPPRRR
jgi:hypothetical protein